MANPTKLPITYKCGHRKQRDLSDVPAGIRKRRANWYAKEWDCPDCFKKDQAKNKQQDANQRALDAQSFSEDHELPELEGSDKQVYWASIIRHETVEAVVEAEQLDESPEEVVDAARKITFAGWWMDNLKWDERKDNDMTPEDYAELILTGPTAQAERDEHQAQTETENPF